MSRAELPKGVSRTDNGRYRVRVSLATGSTKLATRTYDTLSEAVRAQAVAAEARRHGRDVEAALDALTTSDSAALSVVDPQGPTASCRTFADVLKIYETERLFLVNNSDHSRRSAPSKGRSSLRPGSHATNMRGIRRRIEPYFATKTIDTIDHTAVQSWLNELAADGISTEHAVALLLDLRFVIGHFTQTQERNGDFPWPRCRAIAPARPIRTPVDPAKWGGYPGSKPPALLLDHVREIAMGMPAADRIALYSEVLAGPRIGEVHGLTLGSLSFIDGYLYADIRRQVDDRGVLREWVKTDAGYRRIPLPPILAEYYVMYALRYHEYDLHNPDPSRADTLLCVNSAGRDIDGSFLPVRRTGYASRMCTSRDVAGLGIADIGYWVNNQHLRRTALTLLLNAEAILTSIADSGHDEDPVDGTLEERLAWAHRQIGALSTKKVEFGRMHVSQYAGHRVDDAHDDMPASPVTLRHYNVTFDNDRALRSIADTMDRIARHDLGTLLDEPDERDLLDVVAVGDPDWITTAEAARRIGIYHSNVVANIHNGTLTARFVWLANGGYRRNETGDTRKPALPQFVVSAESVEQFIAHRSRPRLREASVLLGMTGPTVTDNFVRTGKLPVDGRGTHLYIDRDTLHAIHHALLAELVTVLEQTGPLPLAKLHAEFNRAGSALLKTGQAKRRWIEHWLNQLVDAGRVKTCHGLLVVVQQSRADQERPA